RRIMSLTGAAANSFPLREMPVFSFFNRPSRYTASKFNQNNAPVPNAFPIRVAISGVMLVLPAIRSLTVYCEQPMTSANVPCVHSRASNSSLMYSPGGIGSTGMISVMLASLVVIFDSNDHDHLVRCLSLKFDYQSKLLVQPH